MSPSRNERCPCGSGAKFKKCCGNLAAQPSRPAPPRLPLNAVLPIENCGAAHSNNPFEMHILDLIRRGNLPQAEILIRSRLQQSGPDAKALNMLGWIASAADLPGEAAIRCFRAALGWN